MENGTILLTSAGFYNPKILNYVKERVRDLSLSKVAIITTAAEGKENNKYSVLAQVQLQEAGYTQIDFFDLETQHASTLSAYDTFYVCGGNTFTLLKFAKSSDFKDAIADLLKRGGMYIGVSAGSIIVGPSINIANEVTPDNNEVGLTDLTGLGIIDLILSPHYEVEHEHEVKAFENKYGVEVVRQTNDQAILIAEGKTSII